MNTIVNNEIRVFLISIAIQFAALRTIDIYICHSVVYGGLCLSRIFYTNICPHSYT